MCTQPPEERENKAMIWQEDMREEKQKTVAGRKVKRREDKGMGKSRESLRSWKT